MTIDHQKIDKMSVFLTGIFFAKKGKKTINKNLIKWQKVILG